MYGDLDCFEKALLNFYGVRETYIQYLLNMDKLDQEINEEEIYFLRADMFLIHIIAECTESPRNFVRKKCVDEILK